MNPQSGRTETEGGSLYFEVVGEGPTLLCITGGGGDAGYYAGLSQLLAPAYRVVSYERRGNSRSTGRPEGEMSVPQQARDAAAVLRAVGTAKALVFGSSGGAIIALELVTQRPDLVEHGVIHEPPVLAVLPDASAQARRFETIQRALQHEGLDAAREIFFAGIGGLGDFIPPADYLERITANDPVLFEHEMMAFVTYAPAFPSLRQSASRLTFAAGVESRGYYYGETAQRFADLLGAAYVELPGHHISPCSEPHAFGAALRPYLAWR
jgi:pimeloyl-ACP methyl ester carboxylesterase